MIKQLMYRLKLLAASGLMIAAIGGVCVATPALAAPVDVLEQCDSDSQVCKGTNKNSLFGIVKQVINVLLYAAGIIAVIMIIIGGIRYTTSGGDAGQTKSARDTIIYAVAGLVIAIMSFAIVNLVLSKI